MDKLHSILKPFLLRRVKSDVENSLPAKKELILYANMTKTQHDFNEELRKNTLNVSCSQSLHVMPSHVPSFLQEYQHCQNIACKIPSKLDLVAAIARSQSAFPEMLPTYTLPGQSLPQRPRHLQLCLFACIGNGGSGNYSGYSLLRLLHKPSSTKCSCPSTKVVKPVLQIALSIFAQLWETGQRWHSLREAAL